MINLHNSRNSSQQQPISRNMFGSGVLKNCCGVRPCMSWVRSSRADTIQSLYKRAMQLEVDFFSAQPFKPPRRVASLIVCDFDETCTASDTIGPLMTAATKSAVQAAPESQRAALESELSQRVKWLAANYVEQQQRLLSEILPTGEQEPGSQVEFREAALALFLERLSEFDTQMNQVVEESRILAGLTRAQVGALAAEVALQPNVLTVLQRALGQGRRVHVLSVNWSGELVAAALKLPCSPLTEAGATDGWQAGAVQVCANMLQWSAEDTCTGGIERRVQGARDKMRCFERLRSSWREAQGPGCDDDSGPPLPCSVYIGDAASDLPPLLQADYGVVVGANKLLRRVCHAFGVRLKPLCAAPLHPGDKVAGVLYEADNWYELEAFLFGPQSYFTPPHTAHQSTSAAQQQDRVGASPPTSLPAASEAAQALVGGAAGAAAAPTTAAESAAERHPRSHPPRVLSVAGSDSGAGAGIQADIKACAARGVFCCTAITALTVQNSHGVSGVMAVEPQLLRQQIRAVTGDIGADVVKTGMLPSAAAVEVVAEEVAAAGLVGRLVVDPVLVSTSGHELGSGEMGQALVDRLFPLAALVTPNAVEAQRLLGSCTPITSLAQMEEAARQLWQRGRPQYVLVKGGHVPPQDGRMCDVLYDGVEVQLIDGPFINATNTHGTGCTLASAIAAELAKGAAVPAAVRAARVYLTGALLDSVGAKLGEGPQQALNHGYEHSSWRAAAKRPCDLRVYAVTDESCNARFNRSLVDAVAAVIDGGATVVQLRVKNADAADLVKAVREVVQVARPRGVAVIVNDRVDVAVAADADGAHVGQSDLPAALARQLLGPARILGVSVKTVEDAVKAQADGADYLGCGAVYPTATKDSSVVGLQGLQQVCGAVAIPVVAIGGVGLSTAGEVMGSGCAGLALVSALFGVADPAAATRQLRQAVDAALSGQARN